MMKLTCTSIPVVIIDLDNEREFVELINLYMHRGSPASEKIGLISELEEWIQERNPNQLPMAFCLPDTRGCKTFTVITAYSEEPQVLLAGSIRDIEDLLEIGSDKENDSRSACAGSLKARLTAIGERASRSRKRSVSYADIEIDSNSIAALFKGTDLRLTPAEFRLMRVFVHNPSRVFTRDQLLTVASGGGTEVSDRSVDSHIKNLRKKLLDCAGNGARIHTVYGIGYKLE